MWAEMHVFNQINPRRALQLASLPPFLASLPLHCASLLLHLFFGALPSCSNFRADGPQWRCCVPALLASSALHFSLAICSSAPFPWPPSPCWPPSPKSRPPPLPPLSFFEQQMSFIRIEARNFESHRQRQIFEFVPWVLPWTLPKGLNWRAAFGGMAGFEPLCCSASSCNISN
jgi:hypothetical protein